MVRDIKIKTKYMIPNLDPPASARPATSQTTVMLESECIYKGLVNMFVANLVEINQVVFS